MPANPAKQHFYVCLCDVLVVVAVSATHPPSWHRYPHVAAASGVLFRKCSVCVAFLSFRAVFVVCVLHVFGQGDGAHTDDSAGHHVISIADVQQRNSSESSTLGYVRWHPGRLLSTILGYLLMYSLLDVGSAMSVYGGMAGLNGTTTTGRGFRDNGLEKPTVQLVSCLK